MGLTWCIVQCRLALPDPVWLCLESMITSGRPFSQLRMCQSWSMSGCAPDWLSILQTTHDLKDLINFQRCATVEPKATHSYEWCKTPVFLAEMLEAKVSWLLCLGRLVSKIDNVRHFARLVNLASVDYWHSFATGQSVWHVVLKHLFTLWALQYFWAKMNFNLVHGVHKDTTCNCKLWLYVCWQNGFMWRS